MNLEQPVDGRFLKRLFFGGLLFRLFISSLTPVPSYDGCNYLWMAEKFAVGDASAALSEVFPPLLPLLIAPVLWLGLDPFRSAQLVCCVAGALSLIAIVRATDAVNGSGGRLAGILLLFAHLPVRFAGEVYTEPVFHLFGAMALCCGLQKKWLSLGVMTGLCFWLRPEGAVLALAFTILHPKQAWRSLVVLTMFVLGLAMWRAALVDDFSLVAKFAFNNARLWEQTPGTFDVISLFFANLIDLPWLWVEAFGIFGLLALYGLIASRDPRLRVHQLIMILGIIVICTFLARRRFLITWIFVLPPLALIGYWRLTEASRWPILVVVLLSSILLSMRVTANDRYGERVVGEYLATQLLDREFVTGDMTRSLYFAGQRPLPPRHARSEELIERSWREGARFVILLESKVSNEDVVAELEALFAPAELPYEIGRAAAERGMIILERRK